MSTKIANFCNNVRGQYVQDTVLSERIQQMKKVPCNYAPMQYSNLETTDNKWIRFQVRSEHHPFQVASSSWTISSWTFKPFQLVVSCAEPFSLVAKFTYSSFLLVQYGTISTWCGGRDDQLHGTFFIFCTLWRSIFARNLFHLLYAVPANSISTVSSWHFPWQYLEQPA